MPYDIQSKNLLYKHVCTYTFLDEILEKIFRHIGFVRLDGASVWEVFYWLAPEFIVLPTVLAVYFICRFLTKERNNEEENVAQDNNSQEKKAEDRTTKV